LETAYAVNMDSFESNVLYFRGVRILNSYNNSLTAGDIDGVSQYQMWTQGGSSARNHFVYNIDNLNGRSAIR